MRLRLITTTKLSTKTRTPAIDALSQMTGMAISRLASECE
jgi:hypothetical protein